MNNTEQTTAALDYATELVVQLRKGLLIHCVLLVTENPVYASEIISSLQQADLNIVEGTIYPMLSRLSRDGLLLYQWRESQQGPPRKYYQITEYGREVRSHLSEFIHQLNNVIIKLERNSSNE